MWEETIILLPDNVHYVFLSATIPNARQFAEWICHLHKQVMGGAESYVIVGLLSSHIKEKRLLRIGWIKALKKTEHHH